MSSGDDPPGFVPRLLLALFAPGSVEAAVCAVQDSLFSRHGFVSSIALAPLIPVLFLPAAAGTRGMEGLGKRLPRYGFSVTGSFWEGGGLWLGVDSGGAWAALREEARELFRAPEAGAAGPGPEEPGPLFPEAEGFPLGCWEAADEARPLIAAEVPELRFSSCTLALARITVREGQREWWREVYMDSLEERPLRAAARPRRT